VQPEARIRRAVAQYLAVGGWFVFPVVQSALSYKGIADLVAIRGGRVVFVEVKTATGRLSAAQEAFGEDVRRAGGEYLVARSAGDVARLVDALWKEDSCRHQA